MYREVWLQLEVFLLYKKLLMLTQVLYSFSTIANLSKKFWKLTILNCKLIFFVVEYLFCRMNAMADDGVSSNKKVTMIDTYVTLC